MHDELIDRVQSMAREGRRGLEIAREIQRTGPTNATGFIFIIYHAFGIDLHTGKDLACWRGFGNAGTSDEEFDEQFTGLIRKSAGPGAMPGSP